MKYRELGRVIKSPLDKNEYKVIELCSNHMKAIIVSTLNNLLNTRNVDQETSAFIGIQKFNQRYLGIKPDPSFPIADEKNNKCNSCEGQPPQKKPKPTTKTQPQSPCPATDKPEDDANKTKRASVALVIGSGMLNDPVDTAGLAHFAEHCVFLGSTKYPKLEGFTTFCQENGGDANAGTNADSTTFKFTIDVNKLDLALDMLRDMISNPLFRTDNLTDELEALNSEFYIHKVNDEYRYLALMLSFFNPEHPLNCLGIGSKQSLGPPSDLQKKLLGWKQTHFISSNMVIAIEGPLAVKKLADLVVKNFETLQAGPKNSPRAEFLKTFEKESPVNPCKWNCMNYLTPISYVKHVKLAWVLSPGVIRAYQTKPIQFLSYLLSNKNKGGLDYNLKIKGWLIDLSCNCLNWGYFTTNFCTIFVLTLTLTPTGLQNRQEILQYVFSYLKMIKESNEEDLKRLFNELKQTNADRFHFRSDKDITDPDPVTDLKDVLKNSDTLGTFAYGLLDGVDPSEVLISQLVTSRFDEKLIRQCLELLTPTRANFVVSAHEVTSKCKVEERWYNAKYSSEKLDPKFLSELNKIPVFTGLHLPSDTQVISRSLCLPTNIRNRFEKDTQIFKDRKMTISYAHVKYRKCNFPTARYKINWYSSPRLITLTEKEVYPVMKVWIKCFMSILDVKLAHDLISPLISYTIEYSNTLFCVIITGPSCRLPDILNTVVNTFMNFDKEVPEELFESMAEYQIDILWNHTLKSDLFGTHLMYNVVKEQFCMPRHDINFLLNIKFTAFINFIKSFKQKMEILVEVHGCVTQSEGSKVAETMKGISYQYWSRTLTVSPDFHRAIELPLGERCLRVKSNNKYDSNHIIINHYQMGELDEKSQTILEALMPSMESNGFEQLRLVQRLGYLVELGSETYHSITGITVRVNAVADFNTTQYVDEQIDNFMQYFYKEIISKEENYKTKIEIFFEKKDKIKCKDVNELYLKYFLSDGSSYRKLSVQVVANPANPRSKPKPGVHLDAKRKKYSSGVEIRTPVSNLGFNLDWREIRKEENGYFITDVLKFKSFLTCYPKSD